MISPFSKGAAFLLAVGGTAQGKGQAGITLKISPRGCSLRIGRGKVYAQGATVDDLAADFSAKRNAFLKENALKTSQG